MMLDAQIIGGGAGRSREMHRTPQEIALALLKQSVPYGPVARALSVPEGIVVGWCRSAVASGELKSMPLRQAEEGSTIRALRSRIDELEEEVERLLHSAKSSSASEALVGDAVFARELFNLTPLEAEFFVLLARPTGVSRGVAYDKLYSFAEDAPDPKVLDVFLVRIRRKVSAFNLRVETVWGLCWRLSDESLKWWNGAADFCRERGFTELRRKINSGEHALIKAAASRGAKNSASSTDVYRFVSLRPRGRFTTRDVAVKFGLSSASASAAVKYLRDKGCVVSDGPVRRGGGKNGVTVWRTTDVAP